MGFYTKHIISINKDSNKEKLQKLHDAIVEVADYDYTIYDDHIDDYDWNNGDGSKWYSMWKDCVEISKQLPDIEFTVHCADEDQDTYEYIYSNGEETRIGYEDKDHDYWNNYPILYGNLINIW